VWSLNATGSSVKHLVGARILLRDQTMQIGAPVNDAISNRPARDDAVQRVPRLISDLSGSRTLNVHRGCRSGTSYSAPSFLDKSSLPTVSASEIFVEQDEAVQRTPAAPGGALRRSRAHVQLGGARGYITFLVQLPPSCKCSLALPHSQAPRHPRLADYPHVA
jgi:hypothetical protein